MRACGKPGNSKPRGINAEWGGVCSEKSQGGFDIVNLCGEERLPGETILRRGEGEPGLRDAIEHP